MTFHSDRLPTNADLHGGSPSRVFRRLGLAILVALVVASVTTYGLTFASLLAFCVFLCIAIVALSGINRAKLQTFGRANIVTTIRAGLVAFLSGAIVSPPTDSVSGWLLFCVAVLAFAMDGLDGYFARQDGTATAFGARFDMEIDALFGAVLSLILLTSSNVGFEILILGFMRYVFVAASFVFPWLNGTLPESFRRKAVCVVQIAALILLLCPVMPNVWLMPVSVAAAAALVWSFGVDTVWLRKAAA
jgi:phosphatidylglycerophosphate synthase